MGRDRLLPLLDALGDLAEARSVTDLCTAVLTGVRAAVPADSVVVTWLLPVPAVLADPPECIGRLEPRSVRDLPGRDRWPLTSPTGAGDGTPRRISEGYGRRPSDGHVSAQRLGPPEADRQLVVSVPVGARPGMCVVVTRSGVDFTEAEAALMDRFRRLLLAPAARVAALEGWRGGRPTDLDELTRRERDVLERVGRGCSDAQVGAQLAISTRTVHKHLEHIYAKLGVGNRTEAAALLFGQRPLEPTREPDERTGPAAASA
jgi:DNA-binding CsgD family transcriptional regulator